MRNYRFRLYPTKRIEQKLEETLDGCRWLYNYFCDKNMSEFDMNYVLVELKIQHPWLYNYHSKMLQMVGKQLTAARRALRTSGVTRNRSSRLYQKKHEDFNSFTYNQTGFRIKGDELWLSKIGLIKIILHRRLINIKQVTVVRNAGKWYALVTCDKKQIFHFINPRKSVGIDAGITKFVHDSENHGFENPQFLNQMIKPLRRSQRRLSRRIKGSHNYTKAKKRMVDLHSKIKNKRNDFLHKLSTYYSERYDIIFLERLRILNMVKNHRFARLILDAGWGTFKIMLKYKAKKLVEVEPAYTSVDCSRCGHSVPKELAVRMHRCDVCGLTLDRDYNAALNILQRGLRAACLPQDLREVTPVENNDWSMKQEAYDFSQGQLTNPYSIKTLR